MNFEEEKKYWTAFLAVDGVGRRSFFSVDFLLKKHEVLWSEFWQKPGKILQEVRNKNIVESFKTFKKEHNPFSYDEFLKSKDIRVVSYEDFEYPQLLNETVDKPPLLFVKNGVIPSLTLPIAFVGTRKITQYGRLAVRKLLGEMSFSNPEIISGGMYGVDLESHSVALEHGLKTVAVLGYGFDHWYPKSYSRRFQALLSQGLVYISEFPPHVIPKPGNFPLRNRIVAGMSLGVVVVEAAQKSGSHITAQCALDEGRAVMSVPGPITSIYSEGTKWLCNQGATLVSSGQDVLNEVGIQYFGSGSSSVSKEHDNTLSKTQKKILVELKAGPQLFDDLAVSIEIASKQLSENLSQLELLGLVSTVGDEVSLCV